MEKLVIHSQEELVSFLIRHLKNNLSGTNVLSQDEVMEVLTSVNFVIAHSTQGKTVEEKFKSGKKELEQQTNELIKESRKIKELFVFKESQSYQKTYEEFETFSATYDIETKAHETGKAWFDYQLAHPIDDQSLKGIDFVKAYLNCLKKEALFISQLPEPIIQEILTAYDESILIDYRIDVNNLYEIVFNQVIAKLLSSKTIATTALLSNEEKSYLINQNNWELPLELQKIIDSESYYQQSFSNLKNNLLMERGNRLLIKKTNKKEEIIFTDALSEKEFLSVMEKSNKLEGKEKIEWLIKFIQSPYDLSEIGQVDYFTTQEWQLFYQKMPDQLLFQYLLLIKQQSNEEVLSLTDLLCYEGKEELTELKKYIQSISSQKKRELDNILSKIAVAKQVLS